MSNKFHEVVTKMLEAVTLDDSGKEMRVLDESKFAEADELLHELIVEKAREWWAQLESAEGALSAMHDEIDFSEMNADSSHVASPALTMDVDTGADKVPATLESVMGENDFDLESIFETEDDEDKDDLDEMGHYGEAGNDVEDGDEGFDDMMRGDDEEGLGDDGPVGDDMGDMDDDDMDAMGGDDDMMPGGDDDMDVDGEFDFSFLDDDMDDDMAPPMDGDQDDDMMDPDMDEMSPLDHGTH